MDWIKEKISILKGEPQNRTLVEDLEYLNQRLARVYDSAEKKAAKNSGGVKYSIGLSFKEQLQKMLDGTFDKEHSHLFVRKNTPAVYLNLKKALIPDLPIVMSYDNAAISMFDKGEDTKSDHNHGLGIDTMSKIPEYMETPQYIVKLKNDRINALLVNTDKKGRQFFISLELEVEKPVNVEYSGGYKGKQHLLLTAFGANKRYFKKILNDPENTILYDKEKDSEMRGNLESNGLNIINKSESNDIILSEEDIVKNNMSDDAENYSETPFSVVSEEFSKEMSKLTEDIKNGKISVDEFVKQVNQFAEKEHKTSENLQTALSEQEKMHEKYVVNAAKYMAKQYSRIKRQNEQLAKRRSEIYADVAAAREERATKQKNIEHIRKTVKRIDNMLRTNSKQKHVPEELKEANDFFVKEKQYKTM